jgi:hypothetical protein
MKVGNLLFSAVQFVFAVLIILLGGFFIGLQYASHLRFAIARFFSAAAAPFSLIGCLILTCGIFLLIGFYAMYRGVYYRVKMGTGEMHIDPAIIKGYLRDYWKKTFPEHNLSVDVSMSRDQKLEMYIEFPLLSLENQKAVLEQAESELSTILQKHIGYKKNFSLSVLIK